MFTLHQYDTTYDLNSQASTRTFLFGQHAGRIALQAYKKAARVCELLLMSAFPIFPASRPASIFGDRELNFCVRYGNRWTLTPINTDCKKET